jgi:hypothetical protein
MSSAAPGPLPAPPASTGATIRFAPLVLAVASAVTIAQSALWLGYAAGVLGPVTTVAVHGAVLASTAVLFALGTRRIDAFAAALLAMTAVAGPLGPLLAILVERATDDAPRKLPILQAWYDRIALASEINAVAKQCDDIALGRSVDLGAPAPQSFAAVMDSGTLAERQAALGHIARNIHPDYLPALTVALRSSEPVIRVQAAAVAARARPQLRRSIDAAIIAADDPALTHRQVRERLAHLHRLISSGLLDPADEPRARALADRFERRTLDRIDELSAPAFLRLASIGRVDDTVEHHLLARRRFRELRQARTIGRLRRKGMFLVRYLRERHSTRIHSASHVAEHS